MNSFLLPLLKIILLGNLLYSFVFAIEFTEKEKLWIKTHPKVLIGVDRAWEPFDFINHNGKHDGMSAEYLRVISQKTGLKFVLTEHEKWSDVLEAAKKSEIDLIPAVAPSRDRDTYMDFTEPYMTYAFVLATTDSRKFFYEISDFNGKRVGVVKSYITEDILRDEYSEIEVVTYENLHALLEGLVSQEVTAIFDNAVSMVYHIRKQGYSHIKMVTIGEHKRSIHMGVMKDNLPLLSILNKVLRSLSDAEKKNIRDKWVSLEYAKSIDYTLVYQILTLFIVFILGTGYWHRKLSYEVKMRQQSESQLNMLIDTIPLSVLVSTLDGDVLSANTFSLKTFRISQEDILQYNVMDFYVDPLQRDSMIHTIKQEGKIEEYIVKLKRLDESEMSVMISIIPIIYNSQNALLSIMVDLTERIELEESLRKAKDIADNANKSKSAFLANMSHEIRTPMNAIIGFTELLNEQVQEARLKSYTKIIKNAGNSLLTLINDILDLSKIEAGKLEIQKTAINVADIVHDVASIFSIKLASKDLSIVIDIDDELPKSLLLDGTRLRQVLVNLVGNAVKFTEEGYIKVSIHAFNVDENLSKLDLEISVKDTGIGIPPEEREKIFLSFEQQEGQDNRAFGGTGLGLAISKRLVEMMDGNIMVQSVEKKGATFFIYLYGVDISAIQYLECDEVSKESSKIKFKTSKIMVVDDIEDNRELIIKNFENTAIEVITASDGFEAIAQYKEHKPHLILMDIRMPNMDGYEATKKIKEIASVPIIALTASIMQDEFEQNKGKAFDAYLRKPILQKDLFIALSQFLEHSIEDITESEVDKASLILNEEAYTYLAMIITHLTQNINPLHTQAMSSNNMTDIEVFIDAIDTLSGQYNIVPLKEYVVAFNKAMDTFDIVQIQTLLREYHTLYEGFKSL